MSSSSSGSKGGGTAASAPPPTAATAGASHAAAAATIAAAAVQAAPERTKVVVRNLPPTLSQDAFTDVLHKAVAADSYTWLQFYPGKLRWAGCVRCVSRGVHVRCRRCCGMRAPHSAGSSCVVACVNGARTLPVG
jgi:hypothetical protein